jgi:dTDP-4-amino-4,6-dideoxygalactose transaminase
MSKLDGFLARRRQIAAIYMNELRSVSGLHLPVVREGVESGWHLFIVRTASSQLRLPFFNALRNEGLGVQVHYIPVHYHPYYQRLGYRRGTLPVAEDFYARCLSLPIFPGMTDDDVLRVVDIVVRNIKN